ncbi:MAG: hypothetical protein WDM76_09130 [Limisphaerales bacterium]
MEFERGKTIQKLHIIGKSKHTGTLITFLPDKEIFRETIEFKADRISQRLRQRLRELAFLNSGLEIIFTDERQTDKPAERYYYKDGIEEFVKQLNKNKEPIHPKPISFHKETKEKNDDKDIEVHVESRVTIQRQLQRPGALLHQHGLQSRWRLASVRFS